MAEDTSHEEGPVTPKEGLSLSAEDQQPSAPKLVEALGTGFATRMESENFSLMEAVGGIRGVVESTIPVLVFVIGFVIAGNLLWPSVAALSVSVGLVLVRALTKSNPTQALGGLFGVIIGVLWAAGSGKGENYFAAGLWINLVYFLVLAGSLLMRWPLIGILMGFVRSQGTTWRKDPGLRRDRRAYTVVTILWTALFAARLAVKTPLYFAGNVAWLGTIHLMMGVPLFALVLWLSWLLLRRGNQGT
ncbi:MAG: DUF3159 domain-containing protein [Actinomycetaceae bacterium]|nr:DUF3159 domain-containing protein [Actinomycetaceae bacterium]